MEKNMIKLLSEGQLSISNSTLHYIKNDHLSLENLKENKLLYVIEGKGIIYIDGKQHSLTEKRCFSVIPEISAQVKADPNSYLKLLEVSFQLTQFQYEREKEAYCKKNIEFPLKGEIPLYKPERFSQLLQELHQSKEVDKDLEDLRRNVVLSQLIYSIFQDLSIQNETGHSKTGIKGTVEYIENYYMEEITLESLSKLAGLSVGHFSRLFKKEMCVSPIDFLTQTRIKHAKEILKQSNTALKIAAKKTGYLDEFYFSKLFKKHVGISPSTYKKMHTKKIASLSFPVSGNLIALGITPYATITLKDGKHIPHVSKQLQNAAPIGVNHANIESLLKVDPHLIISDEQFHTDHEKLSKVAPVVHVPWIKMSWREHLREVAKSIDLEHKAEKWLEKYDEKIEQTRAILPSSMLEETVLLLRVNRGNLQIYRTRNMADVLYEDLKLKPPTICKHIIFRKNILLEDLPKYDADHIFLMSDPEDDRDNLAGKLLDSLEWKELKAVRKNQVFRISKMPWLDYSASGHALIIDEIKNMFT